MSILSIKKGYQEVGEGWHDAIIVAIKEIRDEGTKKNKFLIKFNVDNIQVQQRYFQTMDDSTKFGELVKAVNNDMIPEEINDIEDFIVGKRLQVKIKHNIKDGKVFANPVNYAEYVKNNEELEDIDEELEDIDEELEDIEDELEEIEDDLEAVEEDLDDIDEDLELELEENLEEELDLEMDDSYKDQGIDQDDEDQQVEERTKSSLPFRKRRRV